MMSSQTGSVVQLPLQLKFVLLLTVCMLAQYIQRYEAALMEAILQMFHWTPPAPMKTVLMGGSDDTKS